jgi:hypothetical protein
MQRCDKCNGYAGEPKKVKIGEKCDFTIKTGDARNTRLSVRTGRLHRIYGDGEYLVIYRKALYHADSISHPEDPSPLSLALFGKCTCGTPTP